MEKYTAMYFLAAILFSITNSVLGDAYAYSCNDLNQESVNADKCPYVALGGYDGPPDFQAIFAGTPTKSAEYSDDMMKLIESQKQLLIGAIGSIPIVGSMINGIFASFGSIFGGNAWDEELQKMFEDLQQEVANVKLYVDGAVTELKVDIVRQHLGGLFKSIDGCRVNTDAERVVDCVIGAISIIQGDWFFFMPYIKDPGYSFTSISELGNTAAELEYILPMWRIYGDLIIATGAERIASDRHAGNQTQAEQFALALIMDIDRMVSYYQNALKIIKLNAARQGGISAWVCEVHQGTGAITGRTHDSSEATITYGPGGASFECKIDYGVGCLIPNSYNSAFNEAMRMVGSKYYNEFRKIRTDAVDAYYSTEFGTTVSDWTAIRDNLQNQLSSLQSDTLVTRDREVKNARGAEVMNVPDPGLAGDILETEPEILNIKWKNCGDTSTDRPQGYHYSFCEPSGSYCVIDLDTDLNG